MLLDKLYSLGEIRDFFGMRKLLTEKKELKRISEIEILTCELQVFALIYLESKFLLCDSEIYFLKTVLLFLKNPGIVCAIIFPE